MTTEKSFDPIPWIADELQIGVDRVAAALQQLNHGSTVPFLARYRKAATGGLDEGLLRAIRERQRHWRLFEGRRRNILESIEGQGSLNDQLHARLLAARSATELEDLYLPFRPSHRSRATVAREKDLEPLAQRILAQGQDGPPEREAQARVDPPRGLPDLEAVLAGARDIVAEVIAEKAEVRRLVRRTLAQEGLLVCRPRRGKKEPSRFEAYYEFVEPLHSVSAQRYQAILRGEQQGFLKVDIDLQTNKLLGRLRDVVGLSFRSSYAEQLGRALEDSLQRLLLPAMQQDLRAELKQRTDEQAARLHARNLRCALLAPPAGHRPVLGIDCEPRGGCHCAALNADGQFLESLAIYPTQGPSAALQAKQELVQFLKKHQCELIALGTGVPSREIEEFLRHCLREAGLAAIHVSLIHSDGTPAYGSSEIGRQEFPDLEAGVRRAISLGRRLQDPLFEMVKLDPSDYAGIRAHENIHGPLLRRILDGVVESCVHHVGIDVNRADVPLLRMVAGISPAQARKIVHYRQEKGPFQNRRQLLKVPGFGPHAFAQASGFLRIHGSQPLDRTAVHPEHYPLVKRMAEDQQISMEQLLDDPTAVERIEVQNYCSEEVDEATLRDVMQELKTPSGDPRPAYQPPVNGVASHRLQDLRAGQLLDAAVVRVEEETVHVQLAGDLRGEITLAELSEDFLARADQAVHEGERLNLRVVAVDLEQCCAHLSRRLQPVGSSAQNEETVREIRLPPRPPETSGT